MNENNDPKQTGAEPVSSTAGLGDRAAAHGSEMEEEREEAEDDRPLDDWCRAQGWEGCRDCPACGGSGERDGFGTFEPCPVCDGDGIIDDL